MKGIPPESIYLRSYETNVGNDNEIRMETYVRDHDLPIYVLNVRKYTV